MAKLNPADMAFIWQIKFESLDVIAHKANLALCCTTPNVQTVGLTDIVYVTGVGNGFIFYETRLLLNSNHYIHEDYARLLVMLDRELKDITDKAIRVSRVGAFNNQLKQTPILRFKNKHADLARDTFGIQSWHHLLFTGDKVIVYIWDSRVVEKVMTISDTKDFVSRMFTPANDNNDALIWPAELSEYGWDTEQLKPSVHPMFHRTLADELASIAK